MKGVAIGARPSLHFLHFSPFGASFTFPSHNAMGIPMPYPPIGDNSNSTGLSQSLCQVSITHPSPDYLVTVVGTGDQDLDPVTYASSFVDVLNGYTEAFNEGDVFEVQPDGRVKVLIDGPVNGTAYADVSQSVNNTTIGAVFTIERDASVILTPRSVHARLPNAGDIGNISGTGAFNALAGDIIGLAVASDFSGDVSFRSSSLVFEAFR